jgi:hypothetical protein
VEITFAAIVRRRAVEKAELQPVKLMVKPPVSPAMTVLPAHELNRLPPVPVASLWAAT